MTKKGKVFVAAYLIINILFLIPSLLDIYGVIDITELGQQYPSYEAVLSCYGSLNYLYKSTQMIGFHWGLAVIFAVFFILSPPRQKNKGEKIVFPALLIINVFANAALWLGLIRWLFRQ